MTAFELIKEEIIRKQPELGTRVTDYTYNVYCSPRVYKEFKESFLSKSFVILTGNEVPDEDEVVIAKFVIPGIGYVSFHPVLTEGYRVEEVKN